MGVVLYQRLRMRVGLEPEILHSRATERGFFCVYMKDK